MNEIRYLISDASKKVDVETHVLRYWEEELGLSIPRNEMGHRYYTEFHIRLFCQIKKLKDRGYQLKAIKSALHQVMAQNRGFMQAAGILEEDMARTLQENQPFIWVKDKEELSEGITRLADYNRLEPEEEKPIISSQAAEADVDEKMQNKPEIKEKDGQTEMKKKGKNRKKPSAWERRNGMAGNEQSISRINGEESMDEEASMEMRWEEETQEGKIGERTLQEEMVQEQSTEKEDLLEGDEAQEKDEYFLKETSLKVKATTELTKASSGQNNDDLLVCQDEKMQQFQNIMNHIIGHALEANNEKLSQEISSLVNERLSEELEDLMRIRDERDEERFRQLDEIIRSYQRDSQGKAEAAAARIPFFKRGRFRKNRHPQNA